MRLLAKVVLIAGGGQTPGDTIGNGRAMGVLFAREGAHVVVTDRSLDAAQETVAMITAEGGSAIAMAMDVTRDDSCQAAVQACRERFGRVDVLVNNVGIGRGDGPATRISDEAWDLIYEVNVKGALHTCRHVLPIMREQDSGVVLNISSIASITATPLLAYKTSKAALNAMTQNLAIAHAKHGIRVNAILPGLMHTPMAIEGYLSRGDLDRQTLIAQRNAMVPLRGGMGSAWDVAQAALFLASDEGRFITGVLLPVDGGQSIRCG